MRPVAIAALLVAALGAGVLTAILVVGSGPRARAAGPDEDAAPALAAAPLLTEPEDPRALALPEGWSERVVVDYVLEQWAEEGPPALAATEQAALRRRIEAASVDQPVTLYFPGRGAIAAIYTLREGEEDANWPIGSISTKFTHRAGFVACRSGWAADDEAESWVAFHASVFEFVHRVFEEE